MNNNIVSFRVKHSHQSLNFLGKQLDTITLNDCLEGCWGDSSTPEHIIINQILLKLLLVFIKVANLGKDLVFNELPELIIFYFVVIVFVHSCKIVLQFLNILVEPK